MSSLQEDPLTPEAEAFKRAVGPDINHIVLKANAWGGEHAEGVSCVIPLDPRYFTHLKELMARAAALVSETLLKDLAVLELTDYTPDWYDTFGDVWEMISDGGWAFLPQTLLDELKGHTDTKRETGFSVVRVDAKHVYWQANCSYNGTPFETDAFDIEDIEKILAGPLDVDSVNNSTGDGQNDLTVVQSENTGG